MGSSFIIFVIAICTVVFIDESSTQLAQTSPVQDVDRMQEKAAYGTGSVVQTDEFVRNHRSPSYDDDDDDEEYFDYSDGPDARHLTHGHKKKKRRKGLLQHLLGGYGGCRGHGCGGTQGWQSQSGGHNQGFQDNHDYGQGGSSASASAGSSSGSPYNRGSQSQANAHSTKFNFGSHSATFSAAQASAGNRDDYTRDYYDY